jgi:hypothetical protein
MPLSCRGRPVNYLPTVRISPYRCTVRGCDPFLRLCVSFWRDLTCQTVEDILQLTNVDYALQRLFSP